MHQVSLYTTDGAFIRLRQSRERIFDIMRAHKGAGLGVKRTGTLVVTVLTPVLINSLFPGTVNKLHQATGTGRTRFSVGVKVRLNSCRSQHDVRINTHDFSRIDNRVFQSVNAGSRGIRNLSCRIRFGTSGAFHSRTSAHTSTHHGTCTFPCRCSAAGRRRTGGRRIILRPTGLECFHGSRLYRRRSWRLLFSILFSLFFP